MLYDTIIEIAKIINLPNSMESTYTEITFQPEEQAAWKDVRHSA